MLNKKQKNKVFRIVKDHYGLLKTLEVQQGHMLSELDYENLKNEIKEIDTILNESQNGSNIDMPKPDEVVPIKTHAYQKYEEQEESLQD
jgi:hypothetical protein